MPALPQRPRHGDPWLKAVLGQVAISAARTKGTYLAGRYRRITARRGKKRALVAVGHTILIAVWTMLTHDQPYHDLGPDHYTDRLNRTGKTRQTRRPIDQLHHLATTSPSTPPTQPDPQPHLFFGSVNTGGTSTRPGRRTQALRGASAVPTTGDIIVRGSGGQPIDGDALDSHCCHAVALARQSSKQ